MPENLEASIRPLKVIPSDIIPATSALLTITSVCANAEAKKLNIACIFTIVGIFSITCDTETVETITMTAAARKAKGATNLLIRKIVRTFLIILLANTVIVFEGP